MEGHEDPIPFQGLGVDGEPIIQSPMLLAMTYDPDLGESGKLHLLLEEASIGQAAVGGSRGYRAPQYIAQIDVADRGLDWLESAPGCTSGRTFKPDGSGNGVQVRHALFVGGAADAPALYVGCYGPNTGLGTVGRMWLDPDDPDAVPEESESFPGPGGVVSIQADPAAERIWLKSLIAGDEVWWVFDGKVSNFVGVVGIGHEAEERLTGSGRTGTVDPATGRLYVLESFNDIEVRQRDGGLFVADGRRVPVPQAAVARDLPFTDLQHYTQRDEETGEIDYARDEDGARTGELHKELLNPIVVDPADPEEGRPRRLFIRPGQDSDSRRWYVLADRRPVADEVASREDLLGAAVDDPPPSDDVELAEGLTRATFTGTARGYGMRSIFLGGTDALWFPGYSPSIDGESGYYHGSNLQWTTARRLLGPCGMPSREFGFGFSGTREVTARLQPGSSSGAATPRTLDDGTGRDAEDPTGRCGEMAFEEQDSATEEVGDTLSDHLRDPELPGSAPEDERPGLDPDDASEEVSCAAPRFDEAGQAHPTTEDSTGDATPAGSTQTAHVRCEEDLATSGESRTRFVSAGPVSVMEAYSDYDVTRDTETGGLVATAHAYARGVSIVDEVIGPNGEQGTSKVHIDLVETHAEAWADGRSQPEHAEAECDRDRTAGTCVQRTLKGVTVVDGLTGEVWECDECAADNDQMRAAMDSALGDDWQVMLREPDPQLARGASNGAQAAVQKREIDEFADVIMKGDLLKTLPGLEMMRTNDNSTGRGRQIYQFAGVELGTTYTRQCRGVIEGDQCVQPGQPLAEVEVTLTDALDGTPLPDGVFGLHRDDEGTLGEGLEALPGERTCTTDAQGQCSFVALEPGAYTLVQAGAPGDYSPTDEQVPLNLSPGSLFEVDVTNVREIGEVEVSLTDLDEQPLEGGVFELYADADTDGAIGLDDPQAATCTTDPGGTCTMQELPLGAYVLRQAAAPEGYAPVEDEVPFALDAPGQVATVGFSNAPALPPADDGGVAGDAVDGGQQAAPPRQGSFNGVERTVPMPVHQPVAVQGPLQPQVASDSGSGGPSIIQQMKDAPGEVIRMIRRSPREAAGFAALVLLAGAAVNGPVRRRLLTQTMA